MEGLLHSTDTTLSELFLMGVIWRAPAQGDMMRSGPLVLAGFTRMLVTEGREGVLWLGVASPPARELCQGLSGGVLA